MDGIIFSWDEKKDKINQIKHAVSFEEAKTVFADEYARLIPDPNYCESEDRFVLLVLSNQAKLLMVCHCHREENDVVRIISARKADKAEIKQYKEFRHA